LYRALNGDIFTLPKKFFFSGVHPTPSKISFFTNYTTWLTSNFYSTDRVDPDAPLEIKIKKNEKKFFFCSGKGEGPLHEKFRVYTVFDALSNDIKIRSKIWVEKIFKNIDPLGVGISHIPCKSSSVTKTRPNPKKMEDICSFKFSTKRPKKIGGQGVVSLPSKHAFIYFLSAFYWFSFIRYILSHNQLLLWIYFASFLYT
jgi:hypothetical protein